MIKLNIKARVFLLAFVPMLFITVVLSIYFLYGQLEDIHTNINDRGTAMAKHLATASEFGVFSGNIDNLNNILQRSILEDESIASITISDNLGRSLSRAINSELQDTNISSDLNNIRSFRHPITLHTIEISGVGEVTPIPESTDNKEILGWIEVSLSTDQISQKRNKIIFDSTLIILSGLFASILLSLWMGRSLTNPIIRLTQAVHNVEKGNMDEVINTNSSGEIGSLEKGFMSMLGKIRISQKELQDKVNETTRGLKTSLNIVEEQNKELIEARTKALEASKTKSRFLANISHEIRTPMNGILGFARLLKKSNLTKEQYDYLDTIEKSSNNLLHLIEDILDLSRVEEGKIEIKSKPFNLRDCIEDVIMLMAPAVLEKGLDITYLYYNDVPTHISAPYERIRQVLINFIGNAIKFSEQGTIVIRVMLDDEKDDSLKISVSDQGIGIPDADKEVIFTPFTQIDDASTRKFGGSGLGLTISKSIIKAMGGRIGLEDNPNKGSIFWYTFPYQENNHMGSSLYKSPIQHPIPVFLYDGNPDTQLSIHSDVSNAGFPVTNYSNQTELTETLNNHNGKSICILSLSLKEINKPETKRFIEDIAGLPGTRLLLLISSIESSDSEKARECGADSCLTKPYRYLDLENALSNLSDSNALPATSTHPNPPEAGQNDELKGLNILLAEDNAINTKLIKTVLGKSGAVITHANNGKEAITAYRKNNFDIILMDIQMPKMNGIDATKTIRKADDKGSSIPIIGMTANALAEDIAEYKMSGFSNILIKPIKVDDLLHEIQYWFKHFRDSTNTEREQPSIFTTDTEKQITSSTQINQLGISEQLSNDLYRMLIDELPSVSNQLQDSFSTKDWESLRKHIHKLLGGISYCDVPELKQQTLNFQSSLKNKSASLTKDFKALIKEIEKLA